MFVLITDLGYEGYRVHEYETKNEFLKGYQQHKSDFYCAYEVTQELYASTIEGEIIALEEKRKAAIQAARDKLTEEELELLGIK